MSAQDIRQFVYDNYIVPARNSGQTTVSVVAGIIHERMGLDNLHPAVCDAINTKMFQNQFNVKIIKVIGPKHGSSTTFEIKV